MHQALWLLLETLGSLLATACLLRAYMTGARIGLRDQIGQFVVAVTDWLVLPLRRVLPAGRKVDWPSIVAAILVAGVLATLFVLLFGSSEHLPSLGAVLLIAAFWLVKWSLWLLTALVLLQAVLSWINPYAPIKPTVDVLTQPFLAPIRRIVPLVGGVDLSPLVLILLVQVLLTLLQSALPTLLGR